MKKNFLLFLTIAALALHLIPQALAQVSDSERRKYQNLEKFGALDKELVRFRNDRSNPAAAVAAASQLRLNIGNACTGSGISSESCTGALLQTRTDFEQLKANPGAAAGQAQTEAPQTAIQPWQETPQSVARKAQATGAINEMAIKQVLPLLEVASKDMQRTDEQKARANSARKDVIDACFDLSTKLIKTDTPQCAKAVNNALITQEWLTANSGASAARMEQTTGDQRRAQRQFRLKPSVGKQNQAQKGKEEAR